VNQARAEDYITHCLRVFNKQLADYLKCQVIAIRAPISFGLDDLVRLEIQAIHEQAKGKLKSKKLRKLVVILETSGGYIEVVERIYNVFRKHFQLVDFIIPNFAYSAGTVLALSGDSIYMDYYSVVGPIDPQFETEDGRYVPGIRIFAKI
jgi:ClpP class serine protease